MRRVCVCVCVGLVWGPNYMKFPFHSYRLDKVLV